MIYLLYSPLDYLLDPVLRGPTIGSSLICLASALISVIIFLRKESLIGESLSHAAYPGVMMGLLTLSLTPKGDQELLVPLAAIFGGFLSALLGFSLIHLMESRLKVAPDAALCFVLSAFFGAGVTLASYLQATRSSLYSKSQTYLFGQAASLTDMDILLYGALSILIILTLLSLYKELKITIFDREFAQANGIKTALIDAIVFILVALTIVIGIRSVGIVLMAAMLIAPAAAARQYTERFSLMLLLAGFVGVSSGFFGNYFSIELSFYFRSLSPVFSRFSLPTGPSIALVATTICLFSLLFAPKRGVAAQLFRQINFRGSCIKENILKALFRNKDTQSLSFSQIAESQHISNFFLFLLLWQLRQKELITKKRATYTLTQKGRSNAERIIYLHRLFEVYLTADCPIPADKIHRSAEEIEKILTPRLEKELLLLIDFYKEGKENE